MSETYLPDTKSSTSNAFSMPIAVSRPILDKVIWVELAGTESFGKTITSGTAFPNEMNVPSTFALRLQDKIKRRWPSKVRKAKELEVIYPDPILALRNLLQGLPGDYDTWQEIIDEPYG